MKAYKGFNGDMTCTKGKGTYQYELGKTYHTEDSKTARTGFHCCENPLDCLTWYSLPLGEDSSRLFIVEAAGDIDEIEDKIACTEITLKKEMNLSGLVRHVIMYMIEHPYQTWPRTGKLYEIAEDSAIAKKGGFAIARGEHPKVRGEEGSVVAAIVENPKDNREFLHITIAKVGEDIEPNKWYTVQDYNWRLAE